MAEPRFLRSGWLTLMDRFELSAGLSVANALFVVLFAAENETEYSVPVGRVWE